MKYYHRTKLDITSSIPNAFSFFSHKLHRKEISNRDSNGVKDEKELTFLWSKQKRKDAENSNGDSNVVKELSHATTF